jgi:Asp-tRNA(Asn)/Glu-tRNA(Gln) amidotransferase A subunit family amidase
VRGGVVTGDDYAGHSVCAEPTSVYAATHPNLQTPGGSSSGSAVAVSAGLAPIALGSETEGSLIIPASRAALYALKPTAGIVSSDGVVPFNDHCDTVGPMARTAAAVAQALDVIVDSAKTNIPTGGYASASSASWAGLNIGAVDFPVWRYPSARDKLLPGAIIEMVCVVT